MYLSLASEAYNRRWHLLTYEGTTNVSTGVQTLQPGVLDGPGYLIVRRLHSLMGIAFGGYLLVHLLVNASITQGGTVYQDQVDKIHGLPFLALIEVSAIFVPFLFHAFYGVWIAVNGRPNVVDYPYQRNVSYVLQRLSAVVILLFVLFHVLSLKFHLFGESLAFVAQDHALASIGRHMDFSWWLPWVIYPIGVVAAAYHTSNGIRSAAITWGLTISPLAQRRFATICGGLFVIMTTLGIVAVIAAAQIDPAALPPIEAIPKSH